MAKKRKKKKSKKVEIIPETKEELIARTHEEWKFAHERYHILLTYRKNGSISKEGLKEMINLKMPPIGWAEEMGIEIPKPVLKEIKNKLIMGDGEIEVDNRNGSINATIMMSDGSEVPIEEISDIPLEGNE